MFGVSSGLIAILSCVEPCRTYTVGGNPKTRMLEAQLGLGKCLHYYFYRLHPVFGFMHLRLQTWHPFFGPRPIALQRKRQLTSVECLLECLLAFASAHVGGPHPIQPGSEELLAQATSANVTIDHLTICAPLTCALEADKL